MDEKKYRESDSSAIITNVINSDKLERFLVWQAKLVSLQSEFEGFIGFKLEAPKAGIRDYWVTTVAFDSDKHLETWLNAPKRAELLTELKSFSELNELKKVHNGFNFWFTKPTPERSIWKENALVLLTLYPVVFLFSFFQNAMMAYGVPFWLMLFFACAFSTAVLGWITVPLLMKFFDWWLNPPKDRAKLYTIVGSLLVLVLYIVSLLGAYYLAQLTA
jgi:uncharacterized protein